MASESLLEKLLVKLELANAAYIRALRDSESKTRKTMAAIGRVIGSVGKAFKSVVKAALSFKGALFALAGAGGLGLIISNSLEAIDNIGKMSTALGVSTRALSEFRLVTSIGGVDLEKFTMSLQRLLRALGEAQGGVAEYADTFKDLGIDVNAISDLSIDQQFEIVADALANMDDKVQQVRASMDLFGRSGAQLLPVFAGGAEGIRALREEARLFGLSLSENAVRRVEAANDAIARLKSIFTGLANQFTAALSPAIREFVDILRELIMREAQARGGINNFAQELAVRLINAVRAVINALFEFQRAAETVLENIRRFWEGLPFVRGEREIRREINKATNAIEAQSKAFGRFSPRVDELRRWLDELTQELSEYNEVAIETFSAQELFNESMDRLVSSVERGVVPLKALGQETSNYTGQVKEASKAVAEFEIPLLESEKQAEETTEKIKGSFTSLKSAIGDVFADILQGGENTFQNLANSILRIFTRLAGDIISQQLAFAATNFIGGLGGGAGLPPPITPGVPSQRGNVFTGRGTAFLEGLGPEAVVPLKRTSSGDLGVQVSGDGGGGSGGEPTVEVVINNNTGANVTTEQVNNGQRGKSLRVTIGEMMRTDLLTNGPLAQGIRETTSASQRLVLR